MRKWIALVIGALLVLAGVMVGGPSGASRTTASPQPAAPARVDVDSPDDSLLRWPLPPGAEKYAAIDGKWMHRDVVPQTGEVAVTSGGKTIELDSAQPNYAAVPTPAGGLDLEAVYVGLGAEADYAGKDVKGAAVFYYTQVGLQLGTDWAALAKRADAKGAAAIFEVDMLPGNMRYQGYPSNTEAPAFTVGSGDGFAVRDMFAAGGPGQGPRVKGSLAAR